jgi:site-specific DNA-methyltransferase (adenine-specific)
MKASRTDKWATPWPVFNALDREFGFTVDVCAEPRTAKCRRFYTEQDDALSFPWSQEIAFCNPPYSNIGPWMHQALSSLLCGTTTVMLLPANRFAAKYWTEFAYQAAEWRIYEQRIKFIDPYARENWIETAKACTAHRPPYGVKEGDIQTPLAHVCFDDRNHSGLCGYTDCPAKAPGRGNPRDASMLLIYKPGNYQIISGSPEVSHIPVPQDTREFWIDFHYGCSDRENVSTCTHRHSQTAACVYRSCPRR